ncbi:dihydropyrimidinase-related protein 5-like [Etheostoma cragini]|uniref:dihydropyrimidinase-related protein 5-like n=1 Tax=Etheostoma cragini TaxID=417921 RepID=UPI00155EAD04|nr:dihydropyrimidinase-related protein 5-like [Etheostoma cragini]
MASNNGSAGKWEVVKKGKKNSSAGGGKKPGGVTGGGTGGRKALGESNLPSRRKYHGPLPQNKDTGWSYSSFSADSTETQTYKRVDRDPYSGDVAKVANTMKKELGLGHVDGEASNKACPRAHQGVRDLHESSFSLSAQAALLGGTTMVMALALPEQHCSLVDAYEKVRGLGDAKACCDYALHVGVTWWGPKVRSEMETLVREHGVNSFQMYMAYKDLMMLRDSELYQALQTCKDIGAIARVHAENGELVAEGAKEALELGISGPEGIEISRPEELESEATHRAVTIANRAHCPVYLVNVSSISAGDMVAAAKMQGKVVHAETTVAHAVLNGMHYYHQDWAHAAAHVTVPPLRLDPNTPSYLMGLLGNDSLSVVASEHRPFSTKQRALGKEDFTKIPHGMSGVQDRMSVIWERGVVRTVGLHESSFSLSGSQVDDHIPKRSSARILAPPGGRSSGIW